MKFKKVFTLLLICFVAYLMTFFVKTKLLKSDDIDPLKTLMVFNNTYYDFGNILANKEVGYYFVYKNIGENPLKLEFVNALCGCTVPEWSKNELLPGKTDSLFVSYDAKEIGFFSKRVLIYSNAETSPDVLYIKGTVLPSELTK